VLAQTSTDATRYRFPLAAYEGWTGRDADLSVRFKPIAGEVDQAAGLLWRYLDPDNYYIVRANALEDNVVLYKVEAGKRTDLDVKGAGRTYGVEAEVPAGAWSELRVIARGGLFTVYLNGRQLSEVEDSTFREAGRVGLWTKAAFSSPCSPFPFSCRRCCRPSAGRPSPRASGPPSPARCPRPPVACSSSPASASRSSSSLPSPRACSSPRRNSTPRAWRAGNGRSCCKLPARPRRRPCWRRGSRRLCL
jgi:hypothetical protein